MSARHKNKFAARALHRLLDLNITITELAKQLNRPRSTVSKAIHTTKFPLVRKRLAKKLEIHVGEDPA